MLTQNFSKYYTNSIMTGLQSGSFYIRFYLTVSILVAVLPIAIFVIYTLINSYNQSREHALESMSQYANAFSLEQSQSVEAVRQLLISFSNTQDVASLNPFVCNLFLKKQIAGYKRYANFGVADMNGNIVCSAVEASQVINVSDELYFRDVLQTKSFVSGKYRIGKITGKPVLNFGYPLIDSYGNALGVIFASLDLSWQSTFLNNFTHNPGTVLLVIDSDATVLSRSVDADQWVGKTFSNDPLIKEILQKGEGVTEVSGIDGIKRFYAFKGLTGTEKNPSYVVIGIPQDIVYQDARDGLIKGVLALALLLIFVVVISWKVGSFFIVRRVEELQELDKLKSDFVSIASHQLRTPPSAIKWFLEIVHDEGNLNPVHKRALKNIGESNERMINLVNSLLDVSKIEAKILKTDTKPVSLAKVMGEIMPELEQKIKDKQQRFTLELPSDLPHVLADEKLLGQVFLNLINNAIKYTPLKGTISVSFTRKGGFIICKIADTGFGISEKEKDGIYRKFFRGENAVRENIEGSGLGLYVVKSLVERMDGEIHFTSTIGEGTTFVVSFKYVE